MTNNANIDYLLIRFNLMEWDPVRLIWTTEDEDQYLHPCVGEKDVTAALKEFEGKDGYEVFAMEKLHRKRQGKVNALIYCNPQRIVSSLTRRQTLKQTFSGVVIRLEEGPWVCRVFGIFLIVGPEPTKQVHIKIIVAFMSEVKDAHTFLPYTVLNHYLAPGKGLQLWTYDIDDVEDVVFIVPIAGNGFAFDHHETREDFLSRKSLRKQWFYCIHPDRFSFSSGEVRSEEFYTSLLVDTKPTGIPKTFLSTETLRAFEVKHGMDQPRKPIDPIDNIPPVDRAQELGLITPQMEVVAEYVGEHGAQESVDISAIDESSDSLDSDYMSETSSLVSDDTSNSGQSDGDDEPDSD